MFDLWTFESPFDPDLIVGMAKDADKSILLLFITVNTKK